MKKLKKTIGIFVVFIICSSQFLLADINPKREGPATKKQEVIAFLKRHKTKIGIALAAILISYFFGNPPPPTEPRPLVLNDYGLSQTKYQQFDYIRMFFYKIRLTYRGIRFLIYLVGNHPLLLTESLKNGHGNLNIEEIVYGTVKIS